MLTSKDGTRPAVTSRIFFVCLAMALLLTLFALFSFTSPAAAEPSVSTQQPGPLILSETSDNNLIEFAGVDGAAQARLAEAYVELPLSFEANFGQSHPEVRFLSRGNGYALFLTDSEAVLTLGKTAVQTIDDAGDFRTTENDVLRMHLVGADPEPRVSGIEELSGKSNYLIGSDSDSWYTDVATYARVRYQSIYPGIDLDYYGNHRQIEYDFILAPGADSGAIRLGFEGIEGLGLDAGGNLILRLTASEITLKAPVIYQVENGIQRSIAGGYALFDNRQVGFELGEYDANRPLVIDPILAFSTYLGGGGTDYGFDIVLDSSGDAYVTGKTDSSDFPAKGTYQPINTGQDDAFVTKLSGSGKSLVYSTYFGGSDNDYGYSLAVDSSGNSYVTGYTYSSDFPLLNPFQDTYFGGWEGFVTKLSPSGNALEYSTYLGGEKNDIGYRIAVDPKGSAYIGGHTFSGDFPTKDAYQGTLNRLADGFVAKLSPAGDDLVYSTYIGGSGNDFTNGMSIDPSGSAYVTGYTSSADFPTRNAFQATHGGGWDVFVAKIAAAGKTLDYSTYLGGSGNDHAYRTAVDATGNVYVGGLTYSTDFPTRNAYQGILGGLADGFVAKLSPAGNVLVYSTYIGGSGYDYANGMNINSSGNAYVTGDTNSTDFPTENAYQETLAGGWDGFVAKFSVTGDDLIYSTYLGGEANDVGFGITVDTAGDAYVTGITFSSDFPTLTPYQRTLAGFSDVFIAKLLEVDEVKWSRVNIPTGGETDAWVLAADSNVRHLTMANDGTLYAYANPSATSYTLFKSVDSGFSWSHTGDVRDPIVDIVIASDDANIIYYATPSTVHKSSNAGASFIQLPVGPGGAGVDNITISGIDVGRLDGNSIVAAGTIDHDSSQFGGVYTLDETEVMAGWVDTGLGSYDVSDLVFSPNFAADFQLVAVVTDEQDTFVTSRIDSGAWNQAISGATIQGLVSEAAVIAFPEDYDAVDGDYILFVAIDTGSGNGDVYKVHGARAPDASMAIDLNVGADYNLNSMDVAGLAVSGDTTAVSLLAGMAGSAQVYISTDGGISWAKSTKAPTGQSNTHLLMAPDFKDSGTAYAATTGTESALSFTGDGGVIWNQAGLIDTRISSNGIIDLAVSPDYVENNGLFMLTFDGTHTEYSLWRSLTGGTRWERVFSSLPSSVDSLRLVELPHGHGSGSRVVYLAGAGGGNPAIWRSADNGQTFRQRGVPFSVDAWALVDDNTIFLASHNGSNGLVYSSTDGGLSFSAGVAAGSQTLESIALSPDYERDETILIGNTNGWVYYSSDNGTSFKSLPLDAGSPPLFGSIAVAFDAEFGANKTVYAASSSADKGVYRFVIDESTKWESVDSTLPAGSQLSQLAMSVDGALYATSTEPVNTAAKKGGMERSLDPTYTSGPTFETVTRGFDDGVSLRGLWLRGNQLWSLDTINTRLMTFVDSLTRPLAPSSPPDKVSAVGTGNVIIEWETMSGATQYKWQLDYDTDFSTVPANFEGSTGASSARLPALDADTTYYWRVRATEPLMSQWSRERYFTTGLGPAVVAPELFSPKVGASGVVLKPLFQWGAIAGAESYELIVSTDFYFGNPTILKIDEYSLPATAWQSSTSLDYNTSYYWKVRAGGSGSYGAWSAVGGFTTGAAPVSPVSEPEPAPSPEQSPTPEPLPLSTPPSSLAPPPVPPQTTPPPQQAFPDWGIYLARALLLTIVILLITLLMLVVTMKRSRTE